MKKGFKLLNGLLALMITAGILLLSDLSNRIKPESEREKSAEQKNQLSSSLQGRQFKFCLAHYVDSPNSEDAEEGIRDRLAELGLKEGPDFTLKVFNAQGDISTLNSIVGSIASENWDIVFTTSTPTIQAISKRITDRPVVFTNVGDPVRAGLGVSFTDHISNLTGISTMSDFAGLVQLVTESMPGIKKIGTIFTPGEVNSVAYKEELDQQAQKSGLELIAVPANSATEVADAAKSISNRGIQAFTQISDNLTASCGASIIKAAHDSKIPYFGFISKQVDQGAIACVSRDYCFAGVDAVNMAVSILKGKSPQDIPYRFVTQSIVDYNQDAIDYYGVDIPEHYKQAKASSHNHPEEVRIKNIAIFKIASRLVLDQTEKGITDALADRGFSDGGKVEIKVFNAEGDLPTANLIAQNIVNGGFDMVISISTPALQVMANANKEGKVLHVFSAVTDPFIAGVGITGSAPDQHPPHLVGIGTFQPVEEAFETAKKMNPELKKVGTVWCTSEVCSEACLRLARAKCKELGIELLESGVESTTQVLEAAMSLTSRGVDALWLGGDNVVEAGIDQLVNAASKARIPLFTNNPFKIYGNVIFGFGAEYYEVGKTAGNMAADLILGKPTSEISIRNVVPNNLVVNPDALDNIKQTWNLYPDSVPSS